MQIMDSTVTMGADRIHREVEESRESLQIIVAPLQQDSVEISALGLDLQANLANVEIEPEDAYAYDLKAMIVEILMGRKIERLDWRDVSETPEVEVQSQAVELGLGVVYDYEQIYREQEQVDFAARGMVRTADGREIEFGLRLELSREYMQRSHLNIRLGDPALTDPLVLNFGGPAAALSDVRFEFDLDADGDLDQMAGLRAGSGYLVFDRNADGMVNDGHELFGPETGHGFYELAQHDDDGNGWIDEADQIFDRLRIWTIANDGAQELRTLRERGIGAIHLGSSESQFDLKDQDNELQGRIIRSGIFLHEEGAAGTVQQIDLVL